MSNEKAAPLAVAVEGGRLVVSIGVETLAAAFQETDFAKPYSAQAGDWVPRFVVTDPATFAVEVARALRSEREDGAALTHLLLDKACAAAVEGGAEGVDFRE